MLNLSEIGTRVDRGQATSADVRALYEEVSRLYEQPSPPAVLALEAAQASQKAAEEAAARATASALAARQEAEAAAERAAVAKAVADAQAQAVAERAAKEKADADAQVAAAILAQKEAVAESLKQQLGS